MANAFASKYSRFVPKPSAVGNGKIGSGGGGGDGLPPVVSNPVQLRDAPASSSKKARKK